MKKSAGGALPASALTKSETSRKLFSVRPVDEYGLDNAVDDCRYQVILSMMLTLMDKVQRNGAVIADLKRNRVSHKISKTRHRKRARLIVLPAKKRLVTNV